MKKFFSKKPVLIVSTIVLTIIGISLILLPRMLSYAWRTEAFCDEQARKIAGKNWNKEIIATEGEKRFRDPKFFQDGKITILFHEMFKCQEKQDKNFKYFILF